MTVSCTFKIKLLGMNTDEVLKLTLYLLNMNYVY